MDSPPLILAVLFPLLLESLFCKDSRYLHREPNNLKRYKFNKGSAGFLLFHIHKDFNFWFMTLKIHSQWVTYMCAKIDKYGLICCGLTTHSAIFQLYSDG